MAAVLSRSNHVVDQCGGPGGGSLRGRANLIRSERRFAVFMVEENTAWGDPDGVVWARWLSHPGWCSPLQCRPGESGVVHRSTVVPLRLGTELVEVSLTRCDEAGGAEPGVEQVCLVATDTASHHTSVEHEWPAEEIPALAGLLTELFHTVALLSAPVVHHAATVGGVAS